MAFDHMQYRQDFIELYDKRGYPFNDAEKYGIRVEPIEVDKPIFKVMGIHHLTGAENKGNHHIYVDVLDSDNKRIYRTELVAVISGNGYISVIDKPVNEPGANFPMWSTEVPMEISVNRINDIGVLTETVKGFHLGHPDEDVYNTWGHHSFYVLFKEVVLSTEPELTPEPDPDPTTEHPLDQYIMQDDNYIYLKIPKDKITHK